MVSIQADGLPEDQANRVIDCGFAQIEDVQRLMSFHDAASDVSRLNREAAHRAVQVSPSTSDVVQVALAIADKSGGVFDITVASQLVDWSYLPPLDGLATPKAKASWRDIELGSDHTIRFHKPLWIDLGGIAKGYAVDRAIEAMNANSPGQYIVNAGGDLRVSGPDIEHVVLDAERQPGADVPVLELENGSVASSSGIKSRKRYGNATVGPHVNGRTKSPVGTHSFVSVLAPTCVVADALTKVVLAVRSRAVPVLRAFGAVAYWHNPRLGWRMLSDGPPS